MSHLTLEINLKKKNSPIRNLRVGALGGMTPLTILIINTTATAENKLNKKTSAFTNVSNGWAGGIRTHG